MRYGLAMPVQIVVVGLGSVALAAFVALTAYFSFYLLLNHPVWLALLGGAFGLGHILEKIERLRDRVEAQDTNLHLRLVKLETRWREGE